MDRRSDEIETVVVETALGKLAGLRKSGIFRFKGIPFGKSTTGCLRWRMAEAAEPWPGIRDATVFGPSCPQAVSQIEAFTGGALGEQSEDCLKLNVWTPGCDDSKRPVMVWIHGGAFAIGAGSQGTYNGKYLARRDVVVVTINYRLGAFGFLNLADATDRRLPGTGAEGLGDQVLALDWVKRNIAQFGGDPGNVTIFGESAGGMSVGALLASPPARGLFHKAIAQSGAAHIGNDRDRSARVARAILDGLNITPGDAARAIDAPHSAIVRSQTALLAAVHSGRDKRKLGGLPFQPTIDGGLLPARAIDCVREGSAKGIPLLTGTTREEWKLFTAAVPTLRLMSANGLAERVARFAGEATPALLAAYADGSPFERFNAIMTDKNFAIPALRLLEAQAPRAPAFAYRFGWRSPLLGGIMGSCHALELGFVFGTHNQRLAGAFFGTGAAAEALAAAMMDSWTTFARTGNPSTNMTGQWPRHDTAHEVMIFGDGPPRLAGAPNEERIRVWSAVPERKIGP